MAPHDLLRPSHLPLDNDADTTLNYDVDSNQPNKNGPGPEALAFMLSHPEIITFVAKHPEALEFFMKHPGLIKYALDHPDALKFMMEHPEAISWIIPPTKEKRSIEVQDVEMPFVPLMETIMAAVRDPIATTGSFKVDSVKEVEVQDAEMPTVPLVDPFLEFRMYPATVESISMYHENSCYVMGFFLLCVVAVFACVMGPLIKERNRRQGQRGVQLEAEKGEGQTMA